MPMKNSKNLTEFAKEAVSKHPNSDVEVAMSFLEHVLPEFLINQSNDRLVKVGRYIVSSLVDQSNATTDDDDTDASISIVESGLELLVQDCQLIISGKVKVPKVKFGKTNIQMPIVTLGCMRFQQEWGPRIVHMNQVGSDCQDNLVAILKQALQYGINHIETARGYGSSELQLGVAIQQIYKTTKYKRSDLIIQTKIPPNNDPVSFREAIETSLENLQIEYFDLFALHGMNFEEQYDWVFGDNGNNCLSVIKEYMAAGKIRHLGFSTHGSTEFILKCIDTNVFEYVNLHYHYFGSYTASGGGHDGNGNLDCAKLLAEKDMGCFIISPFDKGGRLYAPSRQLRTLTLPDMEPMTFSSWWLWNHHRIYRDFPQLHTYTVGAGRPSDLDQPAVAAYLHHTQPEQVLAKTIATTKRLDQAKFDALGREWVETWWKGLPKATHSKYLVEHNQIIWMYNSIKAFGVYEFAKARYNSFEKNEEKWDESLSPEENIEKKIGKNAWGFVPGRPLKPDVDYSEDLANVPEENKQRVVEAEAFVYHWCRDRKLEEKELAARNNAVKRSRSFFRRTFSASAQLFSMSDSFNKELDKLDAAKGADPIPENGWKTAYDMRPWPDYPDQPSRA